jgi:hypothetical protein
MKTPFGSRDVTIHVWSSPRRLSLAVNPAAMSLARSASMSSDSIAKCRTAPSARTLSTRMTSRKV